MKKIAYSMIVAGFVGTALLGAAGTAAATDAPFLPRNYPTLDSCMADLNELERREGIPGKYGCFPVSQQDIAGPSVLNYR
ncbi:hypothetical protein ACIG56_24740 [Nocardia fusca]|uniref:hypothetical protein n=1 Tax=Nocardia fusca TaxID=941183 RepID=UPI0037C50A5B